VDGPLRCVAALISGIGAASTGKAAAQAKVAAVADEEWAAF
jgi:hypothetical protein